MDLKYLCLFFMYMFVTVNGEEEHQMVPVTVYYESLCPDSIKFFTKQLYPALQGNLSTYVNLTLIPFGKSSVKVNYSQLEFVCHHGPKECLGNKIQACALHMIEDGRSTQGYGFNKHTVAFINCLMDKVERKGEATEFPLESCGKINTITNYFQIENCARHTDGSNYLWSLANKTIEFKDPLPSVPMIVFNNNYKKEDDTLAQENFPKALCRYIKDKDNLNECSSASNTGLSLIMLFVALFLTFTQQ